MFGEVVRLTGPQSRLINSNGEPEGYSYVNLALVMTVGTLLGDLAQTRRQFGVRGHEFLRVSPEASSGCPAR